MPYRREPASLSTDGCGGNKIFPPPRRSPHDPEETTIVWNINATYVSDMLIL